MKREVTVAEITRVHDNYVFASYVGIDITWLQQRFSNFFEVGSLF